MLHRESFAQLIIDRLTSALTIEFDSGPVMSALTEYSHVHDALHREFGRVRRARRSVDAAIPLHSGACITLDGQGLLITASTGGGKSTLTALLCSNDGAQLITDDTAWIEDGVAHDIGAPIAIRSTSPIWPQALDLWYADASSRLLVLPQDLGGPPPTTSGEITHLIFPHFGVGYEGTHRIPPAKAFCLVSSALMRPCSDAEYLQLADMTATCPAVETYYHDSQSAMGTTRMFVESSEQTKACVQMLSTDQHHEARLLDDVKGIRFDDDVVVFRPSHGTVVWIANWANGIPLPTSASLQLLSLGLSHG